MNVFKLKTGLSQTYSIDKEKFEELTRKKPPYYTADKTSLDIQYAVCPACDNPIRVLGLYKELRQTPHGRHSNKTIHGLATYNKEAYSYCPYSRKSKSVNKEDRKDSFSELPLEIKRLLLSHFDKVVYILSSRLGIKFSSRSLKNMLKTYIVSSAYAYPHATTGNIPWIFAYLTNAQTLFGAKIKQPSNLATALLKSDSIQLNKTNQKEWVQISNQEGKFTSVSFSFIHHKFKKIGEETKESITFIVHEANKELYEEQIDIDNIYFNNLLLFKDWKDKEAILNIALEYL